MDLLIKNIAALVTCDENDRILYGVSVYIKDGKIQSIGNCPASAETVIDGSGYLCYPGLVNTHHHLYQFFSRNIAKVQNMELFPWLKTLYEIWKNLDEKAIYLSSLCAMGELMKNGCTTCFDHHYVFPPHSEGFIDAQFFAAEKLGMRFHASRGSMDLSVKDGGLPPDSVVQDIDTIMRDSIRLIEKYHDAGEGSMRQVALAPCSPFSVSGELMRQSALLARDKKVRLHTHLAETLDEQQFTLSRFNMRPLEYMETLGWLGEDVWYAHGIHFNDEELIRLKQTGTGIAHCPISNMKLASGVCRVPELIKLGVKVGLAVDGSASNDGSSLLEELRAGYLMHRLTWKNQAPSGYGMLKLATAGSASLLGRDDIGSIQEGKRGDMFMVDANRLSLVGATEDAGSLLSTVGVHGADYTIVEGKITVQNGMLVSVDEAELSAESNQKVRSYLQNI